MADNSPVALITGGARRLGAATARALHARGLRVIIHCRNSMDEAVALQAELNKTRRDSAHVLCADLDDCEAVRQLAVDALKQWQRIDVLVNNASSFYPVAIEDSSDDDWIGLVHSNLRAPFVLIQALAPALRRAQGAIVNLIDIYAEKPLAGHALYSVAKAGLAQLTRASARELGPDIRVNGVSPGPILWPENGQDNQQAIIDSTALKRAGQPSDIAGAVTFLALDAPFVTGQILAVDGGRSLAFSGG